ncbi:hypothetical protein F6X40_38010 [Paraburkholderia sp. UCT31]|uniref:hypothetical protein n=1 Tax=Paraburkholderia sp. UCT31 TaxID=2615209 RepID=UPI0016551E6A|nr:hypothetical protein [Paraburkholderia sp. UCT31]MBC8742309.1 hypothetical protein [Paraburkholderia sp. UCT31]
MRAASARCASRCRTRRDDLLAFAGVLDEKLAAIAQRANVSDELVRAACVLLRKPRTSPACAT